MQPDEGYALVTALYRLLGHAPSLEAWAATYGQTTPPPALVEALRPDYDRALVIGFELSPLMRSVLNRIGAPWIDVELSPIRFLDDLALDLRFSWPGQRRPSGPPVARPRAARPWRACARSTGQLRPAADLQRGLHLPGPDPLRPDVDQGRRPSSPTARRSSAWRRPSTGGGSSSSRIRWRRTTRCSASSGSASRARTTDANIYALLAAAGDARLLTISSSAAIEARHFGHSPRSSTPRRS